MMTSELSLTSRSANRLAAVLVACIGLMAQAGAATIYEDSFSVNPADNGWTEAVGSSLGDDANIDVNGSGQVLFHKPSGTGHASRSIIRTISTVGFENIEFVMTAFQGAGAGGDPGAAGNTFEANDYFRVKFGLNTGTGTNDFNFQDVQVWNGVHDLIGEGGGGGNFPPNTVSTATASIPLPAGFANNPDLEVKIIARVNVPGEDYYADNFILTGTPIAVPEPGSILLLTGVMAMAIGFRRFHK